MIKGAAWILLVFILPLAAQSHLTFGAKGVYGGYRNSIVKTFFSERLDLFYNSASSLWGGALGWKRNDIAFDNGTLPAGNFNHLRLNLWKTLRLRNGSELTLSIDGNWVLASDAGVDGRFPLYANLSYLSAGKNFYLDAALHYFPNAVADKLEGSATVGKAFFNYYLWAQIGVHLSRYERPVQEMKSGWSIHPELTYYLIPGKMTVTAYGIWGRQVFSYNPGTLLLYMSEVTLRGNAGVTLYYRLGRRWQPYLDAQWEGYEDRRFPARFQALYFTVGLFYHI